VKADHLSGPQIHQQAQIQKALIRADTGDVARPRADIVGVRRFKNSKKFASYLRSVPKVANSNTPNTVRGTNKKGRKLCSTLLT
jgi:transposase